MALYELRVDLAPGTAETVDTVLLERGSENWTVVEDVIAKSAWLVGVAPEEAQLRREWSELEVALRSAAAEPPAAPILRELPDSDWRDSYKAHFRPWQFGRLHWVPVWERGHYTVPAGDAVLWLDPGLAFGTGNHETTRLCIERLVAIDAGVEERGWSRETARVIDAGCGSGILALSAALLGWRRIFAFDNDAEAVRVSQENAALNGLIGRVDFHVGDLDTGLSGREAEVVLANIQADVLTRFSERLLGAVVPGGVLILSGILADENAAVRAAFQRLVPEWRLEHRILGEWSDVVLARPA